MNVALRQPISVEQFLAWEERQELRYEFDGIRPIAMTGGTFGHDAIQLNLTRALSTRLRGTPCRAHGNSLKIEVMGRIRYPDAFITCGPPPPANSTVVTNPVVIFDVLSPGTAQTDRFTKNREYAAITSVQRYVIVEQDAIAATVFERAGEDWVGHIATDDAVLDMPEIGISIPLSELYEGVELPPATEGDT